MGETLQESINKYCEKYSVDNEGKEELIQLLNRSIIEISRGILDTHKTGNSSEVDLKKDGEKRFKSKKAEEYADEHGLTLENFDIKDVSKKDVELKIREMAKQKKMPGGMSKNVKNNKEDVTIKKGKEKVICSGINKKREACKSTGNIKPDGAKRMYCFRHAEDYRSFECDSDSSDDEKSEECEECVEKEFEVE